MCVVVFFKSNCACVLCACVCARVCARVGVCARVLCVCVCCVFVFVASCESEWW